MTSCAHASSSGTLLRCSWQALMLLFSDGVAACSRGNGFAGFVGLATLVAGDIGGVCWLEAGL